MSFLSGVRRRLVSARFWVRGVIRFMALSLTSRWCVVWRTLSRVSRAGEGVGGVRGGGTTGRCGESTMYTRPTPVCVARRESDCTALSEYPSKAGEIDAALLDQCDQVFQ